MPDEPLLTRRSALRLGAGAVAAVGLAGCTTASNGTPTSSASTPSPGSSDDPDSALRVEVATAELRLATLYATVAGTSLPGTRTLVTSLGARHTIYAQTVLPTPPASPLPSTSATKPSGDPTGALRRAETAAAAERVAQSLRAQDPELARQIVLISAGAAAAAERLRTVAQ